MASDYCHYRAPPDASVTPAVVDIVITLLEKYKDRSIPPPDFTVLLLPAIMIDEDESNCDLMPIITELFLNVIRVERLLNGMIAEYYAYKVRRMKEDVSILKVMIYMILFKLRDESIPYILELLLHLHPLKAYHLIVFFSLEELPLIISAIAHKYYDVHYLEGNILQEDFTHCIEVLHRELRQYLSKKQNNKKDPIVPNELNVLKHVPKPKVPQSSTMEKIPVIKAKELPETTYKLPEEEEILKEMHEANKEKAQKLLQWAQERAFKCATVSSNKLKPRKSKDESIMEERTIKARRIPNFKELSVPVKTNTATVLRRAAKFVRDEEKEVRRLEAMSTGTCNLQIYENLLAEIQEEKEQKTLAVIEKKHLKGLITREEALLSRQQLLQANKDRRERFEREKQEWDMLIEQMKRKEEEKIKELSEKCRNIRAGAMDAKKTLQEQKQKIAQDVSEETKEMLVTALTIRKDELAQRVQLIKELRALQTVRSLRVKEFDATTSSGIGSLCEMSLSELRERLFILQVDFKEELEHRKAIIKRQRERQQKMLEDTKDFIRQQETQKKFEAVNLKKIIDLPKDEELEGLKQQLLKKREMRKKIAETNS